LLIFILGNALGGAMSQHDFNLSLGIYSEKSSDLDQGIDHYLDAVAEEINLTKTTYKSRDELEDMIIDNEVDAGIIIKENNEIEVVGAPNRSIQYNVTSSLMENFDSLMITQAINEAHSDASYEALSLPVNQHSIEFKGKSPSAVDYYAITMLAMFMLYGAGYGAYAIRSNYMEIRGQRIRVTRVKFYEHFIGLALGTVLTIFMQGLAIVLFSKYAFGAHLGSSLIFILFVILTFAILSTGLGMFMALMFKDKNQGSNIINVLIPVFTLISGGFVTLSADGIFKVVQNFIPNYHFHQVLLNYAFETSADLVTRSMLILWAMIVFCYAGTLVLKGRRAA
jgi:ABC-2 type transport system permease protein